MRAINIFDLKDVFNEWFESLVEKGDIKHGDYTNDITANGAVLYELTGTKPHNKYPASVGFVVLDKYMPDDRGIIHIYQDHIENVCYIIEDCEKIYICKKHNTWWEYSWENMEILAEMIAKKLNLEFVKENEQRVLEEYVSVVSKEPSNVIEQTVDFMLNKILEYNYVIFQSNFAYMNTDVPFTMTCEKGDVDKDGYRTIDIHAWSQDWSSFSIDDFENKTLLREWQCFFVDAHHPDLKDLNAKQIIEHEDFTDTQYSFINDTLKLNLSECGSREAIKTLLVSNLLNEYGIDRDGYYYNGIVAILYKER